MSTGVSGGRFDNRLTQFWCILIVCSSFFLIIGCKDGPTYERVVSVSGIVTDADTGAPIDSAWVALGDTLIGTWEFTDSDGRFDLPSPPFTIRVLNAGKAGYNELVDTLMNVTSDIEGLQLRLRAEEK